MSEEKETKRYVKVPVDFGYMTVNGQELVGAFLRIGCMRITTTVGYGADNDDAFSDLLAKLGYEEAKA